MIGEFLFQNLKQQEFHSLQVGKYFYTDFQDIKKGCIVLLSCPDLRGANLLKQSPNHKIIQEIAALYAGNWTIPIFYIGEIIPGIDSASTHFALQQVTEFILSKEAFPIVLGGSSELIYPMYSNFRAKDLVHYVAVDSTIFIDEYGENDFVNEKNFLSKMIKEEPSKLFHFSNVGYQSYKSSYKAIDAISDVNFEAIRLGELIENIQEAEPIFRTSDIISINTNAIQSFTQTNTDNNPNGFNSREICAIARYMGLSPKLKMLLISNYLENEGNSMAKLLAQVIWYTIEGLNIKLSYKESENNYIYYTTLHENKEIIFIKDKIINRWWIQLDNQTENNKALIPCTYKDYIEAVEGKIPDRYWKSSKKFL